MHPIRDKRVVDIVLYIYKKNKTSDAKMKAMVVIKATRLCWYQPSLKCNLSWGLWG